MQLYCKAVPRHSGVYAFSSDCPIKNKRRGYLINCGNKSTLCKIIWLLTITLFCETQKNTLSDLCLLIFALRAIFFKLCKHLYPKKG